MCDCVICGREQLLVATFIRQVDQSFGDCRRKAGRGDKRLSAIRESGPFIDDPPCFARWPGSRFERSTDLKKELDPGGGELVGALGDEDPSLIPKPDDLLRSCASRTSCKPPLLG